MVIAAEIHTATHFYAWKSVILTATRCPASAFAATLYQVHHSCRGWRIQTSYWSIMMSGRVKLQTTIDRSMEARIAFPMQPLSKSLLRNVLVEYALLESQLLGETFLFSCAVGVQKNPKLVHFGVYFGRV